MTWMIRQIFDGEYGCEEPGPNEQPQVLVTLVNEAGETRYVSVADSWLTEQGLDEGSIWPMEDIARSGIRPLDLPRT